MTEVKSNNKKRIMRLILVTITIAMLFCSSAFASDNALTVVPNGGVFSQAQQVSVYSNNGGEIRYTLDGTEPTLSSAVYYSPITISTNVVLKAKSFVNGVGGITQISAFAFTSESAILKFEPAEGSFSYPIYVTLAAPTGAKIQYSTNGSQTTVGTDTKIYSGPILVDKSMTIRAAYTLNGVKSQVAMQTYTITNSVQNDKPVIGPNGGSYNQPVYIILTAPTGAKIQYSTNGSQTTVGTDTKIYSSPILIDKSMTIRAAYTLNGVKSQVAIATFTITNPVQNDVLNISPNGGTYNQPIYVTLTAPTGAKIQYSTNGSQTTIGTDTKIYSGPILVDKSMTIRAIYTLNGIKSKVFIAVFTINLNTGGTTIPSSSVNMPAISTIGATYTEPQWISLSADQGAIIRYTTDGTEPNESSSMYAYQLYIRTNTTLKAKAYKNGVWSQTLTANYTINNNPNNDVTLMYTNAKTLYDYGKYDEAINVLNSLLTLQTNHQDAIILLADCYIAKSQNEMAYNSLKQYANTLDYPRVINKYAQICLTLGYNSESKNVINNAVSKYPNEKYLYDTLVSANNKLGVSALSVYIYGKEVDFSKYDNIVPIISGERTLIPIRALAENLGATVEWDEYQNMATIRFEDKVIQLTAGSITAYVNGNAVTLDVPAQIYQGRMMVPLRFVSENFGKTVEWHEKGIAKIISITNNESSSNNKVLIY